MSKTEGYGGKGRLHVVYQAAALSQRCQVSRVGSPMVTGNNGNGKNGNGNMGHGNNGNGKNGNRKKRLRKKRQLEKTATVK